MTKMEDMVIDDDLRMAVGFEAEHTAEEIDEFREQKINELLLTIMKVGDEKVEWWQQSPDEIKQVTMSLHGPAMTYLEHVAGCEDGGLEHKCQKGFP